MCACVVMPAPTSKDLEKSASAARRSSHALESEISRPVLSQTAGTCRAAVSLACWTRVWSFGGRSRCGQRLAQLITMVVRTRRQAASSLAADMDTTAPKRAGDPQKKVGWPK